MTHDSGNAAAPDARLVAALADRYRIERQLGQGGMATVYLAHDEKHDRKVAVKVLKPELAAVLGAERFVVEIKTTAALQHPHILPLFDSGTADGFLYYVMPYIEGETLRGKLNRETQLGIDEAVRITTQVADALDYAHRHGVIHRDIKPENILLHDGRPMVADFGIALAVSAAAGGRMTETGLLLGTPHYMSPEQATAEKEITGRSDIYSLASVIYEMLAGQPPHLGGSAQQIIMRIIAEPAEAVTQHRKSVPPNVAAALAKALEKLPADRFATAKEFAEALGNHAFATRSTKRGALMRAPVERIWRRIAIGAAIVAIGSIAAFTAVLTRQTAPAQLVRARLPFPAAARLYSMNSTVFAVDRTGSKIVYMGIENGVEGLWIRELSDLTARHIPGTASAFAPFFSPDGRRIAFVSSLVGGPVQNTGQLRVISADGGAAITLVRDSVARLEGHWGDDGYLYFAHIGGGIARVPADGGGVEILRRSDSGNLARYRFPQLLPGGKSLLVLVSRADTEEDQLAIFDPKTGRTKPLFRALNGRFIPSGHIVFADYDGALFAVPFDASREVVTGSRVAVADAALIIGGTFARFAVSPSGVLIYEPAQASNKDQLVWVDRNGTASPIDPSWRGSLRGPSLAPDGSRLAVQVAEGTGTKVFVKQLPSGPRTPVSFSGRVNMRPQWTPDSRRVSFLSGSDPAELRVVARRFDASDAGETLLPSSGAWVEIDWMPDGRTMLIRRGNLLGTRDIFRFTPGTDSAPKVVLASTQDEYGPAVSRDGRWLAYVSTESRRAEVYVRRLDNLSAGRTQVSVDGGGPPVWSRSGKELFFRGIDGGKMFVADVRTGATFSAGTPRVLFDKPEFKWEAFSRAFDVSLDDRRFLMVSTPQSEANEMVLVLNITAVLRAGGTAQPR